MKILWRETAITGVCVSILLGLGTWQVQRLHWKNGLIAELKQVYERTDQQDLSGGLLERVDQGRRGFAYGVVSGQFLKEEAILLGPRSLDGRSGYHLLVPLKIDDRTLIVDAGWVSDLWNDTFRDRLAVLPTDVRVRGLARKPDWSRFTSRNSPENDLWFRADATEIAKAKNLPAPYVAILYADNISPPLPEVVMPEEKWLPRNKHLQYALFWYALAAVMLGVYIVYSFGENKKKAP
jgi:surfeit locus 1 family protein